MTAEPRLIANLTRGNIACDHVLIADRALRRMRGLLGRRDLPAGDGLLLQPAPSIHTAFMRFPIDVVFIDRNLQVLKVVEEMPAWRTASARRARSALELAAGEIARRGISIGDQLVVVNAAAALYNPITIPDVELEVVAALTQDPVMRVLLVGGDRRFRSLAALLLSRRGCAVTFAEVADGSMDTAELRATDVVVLDAGGSLTATARDAAQIEALDPPVGVVVVGEEPQATAMPVLAKWGSFDDLYRAIERARPVRGTRAVEVRSVPEVHGEVLL
ncbi:MAG TPA: DUF192 domain-containing protein [Solirubrobacteraceae bacterium]|jgi:hypothetical protein|nr:DUF192 domain-containing protein [Solirubrobacteraceae bacterium]